MPESNATQAQTLAAVRRWETEFNTLDFEKFLDRNYHDDVVVLFSGGSVSGFEQFKNLELAVLRAAPKRYMRIDHRHLIGDSRVVVEGVLLDGEKPDYLSPFCAILSYRGDKVFLDRTYLDGASWPSVEGAEVNPGGLGTTSDPLLPNTTDQPS